MNESKVPSLLEFHVEGYEFERKYIQSMELLVLDTLEWKMCFITPFVYLNYFISKFSNDSEVKTPLSRVVELILGAIEGKPILEIFGLSVVFGLFRKIDDSLFYVDVFIYKCSG